MKASFILFLLFAQSFLALKDKRNMGIYGFVNFNKTLYPSKAFVFSDFIKQNKEEYLQIQFNYKNHRAIDLFDEYCRIVKIFEEERTLVINQLKVNLSRKNNLN